MKKLFSLLLVLLIVLSIVPMAALAAEDDAAADKKSWQSYQYIEKTADGKYYGWNEGTEKEQLSDEAVKDFEAFLATLNQEPEEVHEPGAHSYGWASDMKYHWKECACGAKTGMELHVDPLETEDDLCYCGYHFSDNADLVTLWIQGSYGIKNFNKNVTEYEIKGHTYKDFKNVRIATKTHDAGATVELPENRDIEEGENVFVIKVTAENKKVTKTYTVTVVKESK